MTGEGDEEELLESRHWQPSRRLVLAVVALAAVIAGGAFALTRGDDGPTPRAAPATPSTGASLTPVSSLPVPRPVCLDVGDSALNCGVSSALPSATLAAAHTVLPGAGLVSTSTVTGRDGRVYSRRALLQTSGGDTLRLRIGPVNGQRGGFSVNGLNDGLSVEYGTDVDRRHVELSVRVAPGRQAPAVARLRTLALDPRLFAVR